MFLSIYKKNIYLFIISLFFYLSGYFLAYPNILRSLYYGYRPGDIFIDIIEKIFVFIFTICLASAFWKYKILRILSIIILLLLTINFILSVTLRLVYKSDLNNGITLSILNSNFDETISMASQFIPSIILGILFFISLLLTIKGCSKVISYPRIFILFFSFVFIVFYDNYGYDTAFKKKNIFEFRPENRKYFSNLYPFYHLNYFIVGIQAISNLKIINSKNITYNVKISNTNVQNFVLVIGESARRDNMALYGYHRNTTPNETREKNNLLLYTNAVSPAPLTLISIPLMLSVAMPEDFSYATPKYADNIIHLANYSGFDTYWLTTQKFPGQELSLLSVFENYAKHVERVDGVYDEKLLPELDKALNESGKKFIILHINGSHPTYCDKYPSTENYFKGGKGNQDCYDNSIRYTDKILGEIFKKLNASSSILVYVSDHGKTKDKSNNYVHADTKDNTRIPFYIWYSDKVNPDLRKTGTINELTQTTILYDLMANLMGISTNKKVSDSMRYHKNLKFVKSNFSVINYINLPEK